MIGHKSSGNPHGFERFHYRSFTLGFASDPSAEHATNCLGDSCWRTARWRRRVSKVPIHRLDWKSGSSYLRSRSLRRFRWRCFRKLCRYRVRQGSSGCCRVVAHGWGSFFSSHDAGSTVTVYLRVRQRTVVVTIFAGRPRIASGPSIALCQSGSLRENPLLGEFWTKKGGGLRL